MRWCRRNKAIGGVDRRLAAAAATAGGGGLAWLFAENPCRHSDRQSRRADEQTEANQRITGLAGNLDQEGQAHLESIALAESNRRLAMLINLERGSESPSRGARSARRHASGPCESLRLATEAGERRSGPAPRPGEPRRPGGDQLRRSQGRLSPTKPQFASVTLSPDAQDDSAPRVRGQNRGSGMSPLAGPIRPTHDRTPSRYNTPWRFSPDGRTVRDRLAWTTGRGAAVGRCHRSNQSANHRCAPLRSGVRRCGIQSRRSEAS